MLQKNFPRLPVSDYSTNTCFFAPIQRRSPDFFWECNRKAIKGRGSKGTALCMWVCKYAFLSFFPSCSTYLRSDQISQQILSIVLVFRAFGSLKVMLHVFGMQWGGWFRYLVVPVWKVFQHSRDRHRKSLQYRPLVMLWLNYAWPRFILSWAIPSQNFWERRCCCWLSRCLPPFKVRNPECFPNIDFLNSM